jgi:exosortase/archaeosortase family protein
MVRFFLALTLGGAVFALTHGALAIRPDVAAMGLGRPAAWLAAVFLGVSADFSTTPPTLLHSEVVVEVVTSCSGGEFFALLLGSSVGLLIGCRAPLAHLAALLPLVAAVTILANAARLVCAVQARVWAGVVPTAIPDESLHLAVGTGVFAVVLIGVCHLIPWFYENARCSTR